MKGNVKKKKKTVITNMIRQINPILLTPVSKLVSVLKMRKRLKNYAPYLRYETKQGLKKNNGR